MLLIDDNFLSNLRLKYLTRQSSVVVFVRDIENDKHLINDYLQLSIYLQDKIDNNRVVAHFCQKVHVVKNLRAKLLLSMNIIDLERIIVNVNKRKLIIKSCHNLETKLKIKSKNNIRIKRVVKIKRSLVVVTYFVLEVPIVVRDEILPNKNYLFESILFDAYSYVANKKIFFVCVCNNRSMSLHISQYATLERLLKFKKQDYY